MLHIFGSEIFEKNIYKSKICNVNFWIKNDPAFPSESFPKIHPFWWPDPSLNVQDGQMGGAGVRTGKKESMLAVCSVE